MIVSTVLLADEWTCAQIHNTHLMNALQNRSQVVVCSMLTSLASLSAISQEVLLVSLCLFLAKPLLQVPSTKQIEMT